jgi:hypothetical protein
MVTWKDMSALKRPRTDWIAIQALNVALGVWLFFTPSIWAHHRAEALNARLTGVVCAVVAVASMFVPRARYVNTVVALWLFASWLFLPVARMGTVYADWVFGIFMLLVSLTPPSRPVQAEALP